MAQTMEDLEIIKQKEQFEDLRFYGLFSDGKCELNVTEKVDFLQLHRIEDAYNKTQNPILHSIVHPINKLPAVVFVLLEYHHLDKGEKTSQNEQLAQEIRLLGGIFEKDGQSIITHDCGHIVSPKLGGRMEKQNLFPVSKTMNFADLLAVENKIYKYILNNREKNGRVYLSFRLGYDTPNKPNCPSRLDFFYKVMTDDSHGNRIFHETVDFYLKVYLSQSEPEIDITILSYNQAVQPEMSRLLSAEKLLLLDRKSRQIYDNLLMVNREKNLSPDLLRKVVETLLAEIKNIMKSPELRNAITQLLQHLNVRLRTSPFPDSSQVQHIIRTAESIIKYLSSNIPMLNIQ